MNDASQILVFDRALVRHRRNTAAARFAAHAALHEEGAALLLERLGDVKREFTSILDLGAHHGLLARQLATRYKSFVVAADLSASMLADVAGAAVVADEEFLPFATNSFDLIVSNLSLHWVNDLPGAFAQIRNALRPEGLFMAAVIGGDSLHELRACLMDAELAVTGGISPRVSPSIDMPTASGLLQRAGFALPVTDQETITLTYPDALALMRDLRGMAAANAHLQRVKHATRREVLHEAARLYQARFAEGQGRIRATFDILFLHGWKS